MTTIDITRRDVLRGLGGLALTPAITHGARGPNAAQGGCPTSAIPAVVNRTLPFASVEAYAQKSLAAGGTIDFRVSSTVPYQLSVVRLGWDTNNQSRDWVLHAFPTADATPRTIHPGSYIHVENALASITTFPELTLECWVRPFRGAAQGTWQGVVTQYSEPSQCGYGLFLRNNARPCLYFGDGGMENGALRLDSPTALIAKQWHHLVAVFQSGTARLYVNGELKAENVAFPLSYVTPGPAPLRIGAYGDASGTGKFLDGDVAMPVIYGRALLAGEIAARWTAGAAAPPTAPTDPLMLGCWPLSEESGPDVADASACARHGVIVNRGAWMIGGPSFNAAAVGPFDQYDPDNDPLRGHGLRLSASDLYDCAWPVSHSYTIPSECPPGVYVGRITHGSGARYDVTFVVRRATNRPVAPVLVLCATNTWHAYNKSLNLFSFYNVHGGPQGGQQPTYFQGIEMPWSSPFTAGGFGNADPYLLYPHATDPDYSHLVRAERFLHVWLEQNGYDYDVVGDRDLHMDPGMLSSYRILFIVGHSEYWSAEARNAVRDYLAAGGKVVMASGNTMFWRISFDDAVLECRKLPTTVGGHANAKYGELYHEHDHQRGGLMRQAGHPEWEVLGLECIGYGGDHVPYEVKDPSHTYFQKPEKISVAVGETIGGPVAVGHEWDARLKQLPNPAVTPPLPPEYTPVVLAEGRSTRQRLDYHANWHPNPTGEVISEMVDWAWAGGGRVFAAGSIATAKGLHADDKLPALFRNALHQNGVVFRLNVMAIGQDGHFYNKAFDGEAWTPSFTTWDDAGAGFGNHPPTGVQWAPNSLAAMAIHAGGSFRYRYFVNSAWSNWVNFGGSFVGRPAAVAWGRNRLDLFARGTDGHLYDKAWNGSSWTGWTDLGAGVASDPAATAWEGNRVSVAVLGTSGNVLHRTFANNAWEPGWTDLGGAFAHAPTLLTWGGKRVSVFAVGADGHLYTKQWDGSAWSPSLLGWDDLGGALAGRVHAGITGRDTFSVFGIGQDSRMKERAWDGTQWLSAVSLGGTFSGEPAVASYRGRFLGLLAVGLDGKVQHNLWDGTAWSSWQDMGGNMRASPAVFRWVEG